MSRMLYIKFLAVLAFFVTGGLVAGAMSGFTAIKSTAGEAYQEEKQKQYITPEKIIPGRVVISMAGDVLLASGVGYAIARYGPDYPWRGTAEALRNSDIVIANQECAVSNGGNPEPDKEFTFRAVPRALEGAVNAGVDIFTLANNHVLDFGQTALADTLSYLRENNIKYTGAGMNEEEALRPAVVEKNGVKVAVLAFSRVIPGWRWVAGKEWPGVAEGNNPDLIRRSIIEAKGSADQIIVSVHWGNELDDYPDQKEIDLAHLMVDSGADIVIGHHPHVLQGVEIYRGKIIAYSLGNFIFTPGSPQAREGAILQVAAGGGDMKASLLPTFISDGRASILNGSDKKRVLDKMRRLSKVFGVFVDEEGSIISDRKDGDMR